MYMVLLIMCVMVALSLSADESCSAGDGTCAFDLPNVMDPEKLRDFTLDQLREFSDSEKKPVYVALLGVVYDVSSSRDLYGKGAPFHCYAGRDASIAIAKQGCDEKFFLDKPLEDISDTQLSTEAQTALKEWVKIFQTEFKYPVVGRVSAPAVGREFTLKALAVHNGQPDQRLPNRIHPEILICLNYKVYDVSYGGSHLYGVGKGYHIFAGRDASRSLAVMSFEPEFVENNDLSLLSEDEMGAVLSWEETYQSKYPVIGICMSTADQHP
mmetsp:Transcript_4694/g.8858  ORF Transcript_4694/g.8858 Transcript_4694/m.8858 type:complete len:269 (+) Transcript_4694:109-915(+)